MYQKQFSSEKIQIHKRKRPNSNLVFFSEIKKTKFGNLVFFQKKKSKFEGEKKPRKKFSKLKGPGHLGHGYVSPAGFHVLIVF